MRRVRQKRFERLQKLADGPYAALAIQYARRFLARYPDHALAWTLFGTTLVEIARYHEAEQAFANALEFCPNGKRHIVLAYLGHMAREAGDYGQAASWYRKAIAAAPDDAGGHIFLGAVLAKQGRLSQVEAAHREATRCTYGCVDEAFHNLGLVLRAQERFEEAAECFREAIQLDPDYRAARRALRDVELVVTKL